MKCFSYAFAGIAHTLRTQRNMRVHVAVALLAVALAAVLRVPVGHLLVILALIGVVFASELFNTAIEAVVDIVSPEHHRLAEIAKDAAAGAVLVLAVTSVVVGLIIYVLAGIRLFGVS